LWFAKYGNKKRSSSKDIGKGQLEFSTTCVSLNAHEKTTFSGFFKDAKLPNGSASNISKCVHVTNKKISGYKSHDAHFMLHYLLPMATRNIIPNEVVDPLIWFGSLFRSISQKVIQLQDMDYLEEEVVQILCQLEMIFSPNLFLYNDSHTYSFCQTKWGWRPDQFQWMYPIEKYLCRLKSYVRNKAYSEGSIIEGYLGKKFWYFTWDICMQV